MKNKKIILVDADVISHFIACSELLYLPKILDPYPIMILDVVYKEISRINSRKLILDNAIAMSKELEILPFPIEDMENKKGVMRRLKS